MIAMILMIRMCIIPNICLPFNWIFYFNFPYLQKYNPAVDQSEGKAICPRHQSSTKIPGRSQGTGWSQSKAAKNTAISWSSLRRGDRRKGRRGAHLIARHRYFCHWKYCRRWWWWWCSGGGGCDGVNCRLTFETFDYKTFFLFQPVDVSHIFVRDLHERQQRKVPKKNNMKTESEVRSVN